MKRERLFFGRYDYAAFAGFTMYSLCSLSIPLMIVAMGKSLNFPLDDGGMAAGGLLHLVRSIFMIVALLLCGTLAANFGKRRAMGFSIIIIALGIMCCALSKQYWMLLPCLMLAGFGEGVCEGVATPFVQDLHPQAPERYVNIAHAFWSVGIAAAVICVSGLLTLGVSWRLILLICGILTILTSLLFLWRENPDKRYPESKEKINYSDICQKSKVIFREKRFWLCCVAMFFGAGAEFGLTFWATAYIELTFKTTAFIAGLGTGAIALGMVAGRTYFGYIAKPGKLRYILLFTALGTIPLTVILAFLKSGMMPEPVLFPLLFTVLFLCGIGISPYWPTTQVYGVANLPHCDSTLLYIYYSTLGIPGCGFFSWLMGLVGDHFGLKGTILVVPACLAIFAAVIYYECWIRKEQK